jgi:eukaryotic-like serine/threonine-protein kinase
MICPACGTETAPTGDRCTSCQTPLAAAWTATSTSWTAAPTGVPDTTGTSDATGALGTIDATIDPSESATVAPLDSAPKTTRATGKKGVLARGQAFGPRYHIISLLGTGGMGEVYRAWDAELGLALALKVVRPAKTADPVSAALLERQFKNELVLARQVTHKNVVRIHDLGEIDGIKYITMPYVEGDDLATVMKKAGPLGVARALTLARQIVAGLQAAHEAAVVHRDLKPANIMVGADDLAQIMDFGIARSTSGPEAGVAAGVAGTLEYMAPEQAKPGVVDQRADIYAFGLIFYEMLAGRRKPSGPKSALADMKARFENGVPPVRSINPEIPEPDRKSVV